MILLLPGKHQNTTAVQLLDVQIMQDWYSGKSDDLILSLASGQLVFEVDWINLSDLPQWSICNRFG